MSRPREIWSHLNAPCSEVTRLASKSLDGDLGFLERLSLRSHLLYCRGCRRYLRQITLVRDTMRRLAGRIESGPGPSLPDLVRARIIESLGGWAALNHAMRVSGFRHPGDSRVSMIAGPRPTSEAPR